MAIIIDEFLQKNHELIIALAAAETARVLSEQAAGANPGIKEIEESAKEQRRAKNRLYNVLYELMSDAMEGMRREDIEKALESVCVEHAKVHGISEELIEIPPREISPR